MVSLSWYRLRLAVSIFRSARSAIGASSWVSSLIASLSERDSLVSGWRRRVSEKRLSRVALSASRYSTSHWMLRRRSCSSSSGKRLSWLGRLRASIDTATCGCSNSVCRRARSLRSGSRLAGRLSMQ
ncbi:hypothetical protein D3C72_1892920 [compost metagenome]